MNIQFKEGTKYKLQADYYESILLECVYVEDNTVWFVCKPSNFSGIIDCIYYKLNRKTNKLYELNSVFSSWDSVENTLSEHTADDVWSKRTGSGGGDGYYSGIGQD